MSQTPQGPGWWVASDGQWYPPEQHPGMTSVVAPAAPQQFIVQQQPLTSGMAVASLVLSLLWLGGIGSILAIIFGFVSRNDIRRSNGAKTGGGLAIAGIVIGFVGVAGIALVILVLAALGTAANNLAHDLQPRTVTFGTTVDVTSSLNPGLRSMTVYSLRIPSPATVAGTPKGDSLAVARMKVCADNSGAQGGFDSFFLSAYFADGQSANSDLSATVRGMGRNLNKVSGLAANQCVSGYVPFDITKGTRPIGVEYDADLFFRVIRWTG